MEYKRIYTIVMLYFLTGNALWACICGKSKPIDHYDYIGLVEVMGVEKVPLEIPKNRSNSIGKHTTSGNRRRPDIPPPPPPPYYLIHVKVIEQFKGEDEKTIAVWGGNDQYNLGMTSCDLSLSIGEVWIIYGKNHKDRIYTSYCSHSHRHMDYNNEIDYKRNRSIHSLASLRKKYSSKNNDAPKDGLHEEFFNYDRLRLSECYRDGKLHGLRTAFFFNQKKMLEEYYVNGEKDGDYIWYHKDGNLDQTGTFSMGINICETYLYTSKGTLHRIDYYDDDGRFIVADKIN